MSLKTVPYHGQEEFPEDRMLFVRTDGILETMVNVPLLVASVIIVVAVVPMQPSFGSTRNLDLTVYPDGSAHVSAEVGVDPLDTDHELELYGSAVDNFVAVGENGFLLHSEIDGNVALIETFGSSAITVKYDIHDLVSKTGRIWTFSLDSPTDFTLLLPKNSAIVGMTNLPINMEIVDDQNQLTLPAGNSEIDYLFSSAPPVPGGPADPAGPADPGTSDVVLYGIIGAAAAAAAGAIAVSRRRKSPAARPRTAQTTTIEKPGPVDVEAILKAKPDIRDDDKEIVKFISDNGGQALESELRKKFLQPRTTMWRAVKRLERNGIIEIEKKDLQNLVKLRRIMEEKE